MKVARRVEKMYSKKMLPKIFRKTFCDVAYGNAARVRCYDRALSSMPFNLLEKFSLDLKILDHCFYNQIAVFQLRHVVIEIAHADERRQFRREERCGPSALRRFQPCARNAVSHLSGLKRQPTRLFFRREFTRGNV